MKLATYKDGSRDGQLVVVSRDLASAHFATGIATRLQQVLDDWNFLSPQLEDLSAQLNGGKARHAFAFDPRLCLAPLPRLGLFAQSAAYVGAGAGADGRPAWPRAGGPVRGPCADAVLPAVTGRPICEPSLAVVTGDVAPGVDSGPALESVRLLMLLADWQQVPDGDDAHALPIGPAFASVAVTPDELGGGWQRGRATLAVSIRRNGRPWARLAAGPGQKLHFGQLIARLAATGPLGAGSVIACGPIPAAEGSPTPTALTAGDTLHIEALGEHGQSVFGAIEQAVRLSGPPPGEGPVDDVAPAPPAGGEAPVGMGTESGTGPADGSAADTPDGADHSDRAPGEDDPASANDRPAPPAAT